MKTPGEQQDEVMKLVSNYFDKYGKEYLPIETLATPVEVEAKATNPLGWIIEIFGKESVSIGLPDWSLNCTVKLTWSVTSINSPLAFIAMIPQ